MAPYEGQTVPTTFRIRAVASSPDAIDQLQVRADGNKLHWSPGAALEVTVTLPPGPHAVTVLALDTSDPLSAKTTVQLIANGGCRRRRARS